MKKINSIIALLLTVVMLAGCGGKVSDESNPKATSDSGDADVIEIVSWWDETPVSGDELNDRMVKRQADIEKKYNVKFKFTVLPADEITTHFTAAILAGDTLGDFVNMRHFWAFPEYAQKGFLLNMSDYLDFSDSAFNEDDTERATYDNNVYGFSMNPLRVGYVIYFNKAIFEKNGIEDPYKMYDNGQWNWNNVFSIAKKLTSNNVWGINSLDTYDMVELLVASNGGSFAEYVNSKAKSNLTHTGTIKGIEMARQATYVDKICEPYPTGSDYDYAAKQFQAGHLAMFLGGTDNMDDFKQQMSDKFGVMPLPLGEGQTDYVNYIRERHFKVAASTSDKERMKKLLPIMYEYYKPFDDYSEIEKRNFEIYTWDEESVNILEDLVKTQYVPECYNFPDSYWNIVVVQGINKALNGEMTATAAMKSIEDAWTAAISK